MSVQSTWMSLLILINPFFYCVSQIAVTQIHVVIRTTKKLGTMCPTYIALHHLQQTIAKLCEILCNTLCNIMIFDVLVCFIGAGDCLVHWLSGANLLLLPGLSGGERIQQGLCHLCRCSVVGHGERTHTHTHTKCQKNQTKEQNSHLAGCTALLLSTSKIY